MGLPLWRLLCVGAVPHGRAVRVYVVVRAHVVCALAVTVLEGAEGPQAHTHTRSHAHTHTRAAGGVTFAYRWASDFGTMWVAPSRTTGTRHPASQQRRVSFTKPTVCCCRCCEARSSARWWHVQMLQQQHRTRWPAFTTLVQSHPHNVAALAVPTFSGNRDGEVGGTPGMLHDLLGAGIRQMCMCIQVWWHGPQARGVLLLRRVLLLHECTEGVGGMKRCDVC
jgi:hypothetical protein